jgi:hypothetical protein
MTTLSNLFYLFVAGMFELAYSSLISYFVSIGNSRNALYT